MENGEKIKKILTSNKNTLQDSSVSIRNLCPTRGPNSNEVILYKKDYCRLNSEIQKKVTQNIFVESQDKSGIYYLLIENKVGVSP